MASRVGDYVVSLPESGTKRPEGAGVVAGGKRTRCARPPVHEQKKIQSPGRGDSKFRINQSPDFRCTGFIFYDYIVMVSV